MHQLLPFKMRQYWCIFLIFFKYLEDIMNKIKRAQLIAELNIMKVHTIKPNFSELARKYNCDRHTVARYYYQGGKALVNRNSKSHLEPYREEIEELLTTTPTTKKAAFEYFKDKYGSEIFKSYSTFTHYTKLNGIGISRSDRTPHPRFETPKGKQLQVDWVEDLSMELKNGEIVQYNLFSATWSYSRFHWFVYTPNKTTEDFLRCLLEVLYQSGGVPDEILTDNMSAIVSVRGNRKRKHKKIIQFEKDSGIKIKLAQARSPQTKGKCESANRYVQWLIPYQRKLESKEELIEKIQNLNFKINRETNQTTKIPPVVLFKKEKEYLHPLPSKVMLESYLEGISVQTVPQTLLVRYRGNGYSVHPKFIGKRVKLVPIHDKLYIYYNTALIAIHEITSSLFNYRGNDDQEALKARIKTKEDEELERIMQENLKIFDQWSQ